MDVGLKEERSVVGSRMRLERTIKGWWFVIDGEDNTFSKLQLCQRALHEERISYGGITAALMKYFRRVLRT